MSSSTKKKVLSIVAAAASLAGITLTAMSTSTSAQAEPLQLTQGITGYGSDTTQDVMNAMAGASAGIAYSPVITTTGKVLVNWDALDPQGLLDPNTRECLNPKLNAPSILRPNGSGEGQRILSRAIDGNNWWEGRTGTGLTLGNGTSTASPCNARRDVTGYVDYARSSSGISNTTSSKITQIPFAYDALTFALVKPFDGTGTCGVATCHSKIVSLTKAQLSTVYTAGVLKIYDDGAWDPGTHTATENAAKPGTVIMACGIQTSSGTYSTWNGKLTGVTSSVEQSATVGTSFCNNLEGTGEKRVQENHGPDLAAKATYLETATNDKCDGVVSDGSGAVSCKDVQLIVGFSASNFVAKSNGVSNPNPQSGAFPVTLGTADGLQFVTDLGGGRYAAYTGGTSATNGFLNSTWNRLVYNMVSSCRIGIGNIPGTATPCTNVQDPSLIEMFKSFSATVSNTARTSNVATITTSAAHGFTVGMRVVISGLATNTDLNGTFTITSVPTATTFTFASTGSNITSGSEAGTAKYNSLICQNQSRIETFGFLYYTSCGDASAQKALVNNDGTFS